jgi:copper transport protein
MTMRRVLAAGAVLAASLAVVPAAFAHARLVRTEPADGAVLPSPPSRVVLAFDDAVRVVGGTTVIRNRGGSVLAGKPELAAGGRLVVLPLIRLSRGDYTARYRVVSNDGHLIAGVIAFAVGPRNGSPMPALSAGGGSRAPFGVARWIFLAGLLLSAGTVGWIALVRRPATRGSPRWADRLERLEPFVLAAGLAIAAAGLVAALLIEPDAVDTRFGQASQVGIALAVVGALAAGFALAWRPLLAVASLCALGLLITEGLSGHALDAGQPRALTAFADVLHMGAASFWAASLAWLAVLTPLALRRGAAGERNRALAALAGGFSFPALIAAIVVVETGITRAWTELSAFDQLWSTRYGAVLLAKIAILSALVSLGWLNRSRLLPRFEAAAENNPAGLRAFTPLRRSISAELVLFGLALIAVAILVELQPGRLAATEARAAPAPHSSGPVVLPPRGALVLAGEADDVAVGLAVRQIRGRLQLQASVLGPDGAGLSGLDVGYRVLSPGGNETAPATPCGSGCYRATVTAPGKPVSVDVSLDRGAGRPSNLTFALPAVWPAPSGSALVDRAARAFRSVRAVEIRERLASSDRNSISTTWELEAPDRLAYRIDGGAQAIVIGRKRWDRDNARATWKASVATPLQEPEPFWGTDPVSNAYDLGETRIDGKRVRVVSFLVGSIPAWFTIWVEPRSARLLRLRMTAAAHFMSHRYRAYNAVPPIVAPTGSR